MERYKNNGYCKEDFAIEHILDDSGGVNNAIIGNLIPLETSLNKRCINKTFEEKCRIFSRFKLYNCA